MVCCTYSQGGDSLANQVADVFAIGATEMRFFVRTGCFESTSRTQMEISGTLFMVLRLPPCGRYQHTSCGFLFVLDPLAPSARHQIFDPSGNPLRAYERMTCMVPWPGEYKRDTPHPHLDADPAGAATRGALFSLSGTWAACMRSALISIVRTWPG